MASSFPFKSVQRPSGRKGLPPLAGAARVPPVMATLGICRKNREFNLFSNLLNLLI